MKESLQQTAIQIGQSISFYDFNLGEKKGRIFFCVGYPPFHITPCDSDFVNHITILADKRMIGEASKNINVTRERVIIIQLRGEQRPMFQAGDSAACLVFVQGALKRTHQKIALGAIVIDQAKSAVRAAIVAHELIAHGCNIDFLSIEDENLSFIHIGVLLKFERLP